MTYTRIIFAIVVLLTCLLAIQAQSQSQYDRGTPPQHAVGVGSLGSYTSTELGTINLTNGALNFKIPLGAIGGRGMSLPLSLNYSSKVWSASIDTDFDRFMVQQPVAYADYDRGLSEGSDLNMMIGAGWTIAAGARLEAKRVLIGKIPSGPNAGCYNYVLTKLSIYLPDRGEIEMRDDATDGSPLPATCVGPNVTSASRGTRWHATDGSGIIFINDVSDGVTQWPAPNYSGVVITSDGTRIRFGGDGAITDRNGNRITGFTDPLGRTITVQYGVPDPEPPGGMLRVLVTVPGYGGPHYYKIKTGIMNQNYRSGINPALPVITGDWDPEGWGYDWWGSPTRLFTKSYGLYAQRIDDLEVLTELVLPDGRSLRFKYNEFGEVAEAELPTGGKIQYDHAYGSGFPAGNSPLWETTTGGTGSGITTDVQRVDRAVTSKRTYPDGVTLEGVWAYGFSPSSASVIATSASGTVLSDTLHYFLPASRYTEYFWSPGNHDGSHYNLWSTGVEWRTETRDAAGVVIAATEQDWTRRTPVVWPTYSQEQPANDNRVNQSRRYLDTGAMAKVETFYDQFNNPIEVKEYDFDQSLKRRAVTTYSATNPVNGTNYAADSIRLIRLPLQQSIYDGAGVEQARTIYEYDVYTGDGNHDYLLSYPSITGHDTANYGGGHTTRGNVTRIGNWIKSSDGYLYTYPRYDVAGNVVSTKDARGFVTTVSFTDDFGNGANPGSGSPGTYGATYAFPTLITSPPPNPGEPVQTARSQYDFSTGLLTGFKDRNSIISQSIYNDPFNRPTLVKAALGISGVENHALIYYAPATAFGITLTKNDVLTAKDQTTQDDAVLRSWTKTDGFGRTVEGWSKDPQGDVKVATNFDALGRTKQVSNPYRPLGETPVYTTSAYDLAGRVTSITTPDSAVVASSYSGNTVTVTDQTGKARKSVTDGLGRLIQVYEDPAGLNYLTSYSYDTLDNLTTVSQGTQTRTFVYDSLKRLTSATNPESGVVGYQYDNNGNLLVKTEARGVSAHYDYDALNRAIRRWYNGSSLVSSTTHNNPALPAGVGATDEVKYSYDAQALPSGAPTFNRGYSTGRLVATAYAGGSAGNYFGYDALGQALRGIQRTGSTNYQTSAIYNLAGAITSMTYPSSRTITKFYDSAGRLSSFSGNLGDGIVRTYASDFQYTALNGIQQEKFGTTTPIYHKQRYNVRGQLWDMRASTVSFVTDPANGDRGAIVNYYSNNFVQGGSGTDNNGNLLRQQNHIPGSSFFQDNFVYDSLNRLTSISEKLNGTGADSFKQAYIYDRYGNRTIDQANTFGAGIPKPNFTVSTSNNRLGVPGGQSGIMSYDNAGNLTTDTYSGAAVTRVYDAENKMISETTYNSVVSGNYSYDGDGRRVKRVVGGVETWQVYGIGGELLAEYPANGVASSPQKEYGYRNGELLVTTTVTAGWGPPPGFTGPNPLVSGLEIKLENLTELRSAVNQLRTHAGLPSFNFTVDPNPERNVTTVKADHIRQLRTALEEARAALGLSTGGYAHPTVTENSSWIYAIDFQELRNQVLSAWQSGGGVDLRWLVADQLGTPRMIFDQTGSLANVSRHDYLPFGEETFEGTGGRTTGLGYTNNDGERQKFTQKERDIETGLDYILARYYANSQGRFTSTDPSRKSVVLNNPQSWNRYTYALNNPLAYVDENGKWPTWIHELIIDRAMQGLSSTQRQKIKDGSWSVDDPKKGGQFTSHANEHGMTKPGQSQEDAAEKADQFINTNVDKAKYAFERTGLTSSLWDFGRAFHTVSDMTSPEHEGYQGWHWKNTISHAGRESIMSNLRLGLAVGATLSLYRYTYSQAELERATGYTPGSESDPSIRAIRSQYNLNYNGPVSQDEAVYEYRLGLQRGLNFDWGRQRGLRVSR